jgi:hypothetical protein
VNLAFGKLAEWDFMNWAGKRAPFPGAVARWPVSALESWIETRSRPGRPRGCLINRDDELPVLGWIQRIARSRAPDSERGNRLAWQPFRPRLSAQFPLDRVHRRFETVGPGAC